MRRLALLGAAEGPWIDISRVRRPTVRVTGLKDRPVHGRLKLLSGKIADLQLFKNGDHNLAVFYAEATPQWLQLFMPDQKREPDLICEVVEQVA